MLYAFDSSEFCAVLHRRGKLTFDIPSDSIRKKTHRKRPDVGHHQLCCVCPTIVQTVPFPKKGELTPDIPSGSISCEKRPNSSQKVQDVGHRQSCCAPNHCSSSPPILCSILGGDRVTYHLTQSHVTQSLCSS